MNEPHVSVGIAHQPTGTPPGTMVPVGIMLTASLGDGYTQTSVIITKEVARSVAKMLSGLADDMEAAPRHPGHLVTTGGELV